MWRDCQQGFASPVAFLTPPKRPEDGDIDLTTMLPRNTSKNQDVSDSPAKIFVLLIIVSFIVYKWHHSMLYNTQVMTVFGI